jgi:signal transduction histidine kinase
VVEVVDPTDGAPQPVKGSRAGDGDPRAHVRDLASLLALPALWQASPPEDIVRGLAEVLVSLLRLDAVSLRLSPSPDDPLNGGLSLTGPLPDRLVAVTARFADDEQTTLAAALADDCPGDLGQFWAVRPGVPSVTGAVVGLSRRADFPTPFEQFLFQATVDQAAVALQSAERLRQAQAALATRDNFFSIAAHELRSPMTGLLGSLQLFQRQLARTDTLDRTLVDRLLANMESQVLRLNRLTRQLLDVSRMETGKLTLEPQPTDLGALVEAVVSAVQARGTSHRFALSLDAHPHMEVDSLRIDQVVTNLIDNAIKFSPPDGLIEVTLTQPRPNTVELRIQDEGPGIAPDHRERIFERAFQISEGTDVSGLGLGLYICRQIVEAHQGRIWVESGPTGGARFVVQLSL